MSPSIPASFHHDVSVTDLAPDGQLAHRDHIAHTAMYETRLETVRPGVWTMIGNGLSNQTFVEGPEGLIAIDTGESVQEMAAALAAVREHTDAPVAAVIYTHFHYVSGTMAIAAERSVDDLAIWGHERIVANRARAASEVAASYIRGAVQQFGLVLPTEGPDGLVNVGLGKAFRNAEHAPFTPGFLPPNHLVDAPVDTTIAGLRVVIAPAPSDADDSITIWFPTLDTVVNNLVWPALYNVFAIRGEEYRDPRVLLHGIDHVLGLEPEYLVATHGPPLSGREHIRDEVTLYRDSIQFLWDQTVRGINRDLTTGELIEFVQLPDCYGRTYLTTQLYGIAEHHVRQIHHGLVGFFDGDESALLPVPTAERCRRMIEGFGGRDVVLVQAQAAIEAGDLRWALELGTWLVRSEVGDDGRADGGSDEERAVLASALRAVARRTTSANLRNWCLTRARDLEGLIDMAGFRVHRLPERDVREGDAVAYVHALRVLLDPEIAGDLDDQLAVRLPDGVSAGLHVRHGVAVPTDGTAAEVAIELDQDTLAAVLSAKTTLAAAAEAGDARLVGDHTRLASLLSCFDHTGLRLGDQAS